MLKPKRRTSGRKYPRTKYWIAQRDAAFTRAGDFCEISREILFTANITLEEGIKYKWKRAAHHIICERYVRRWMKGSDPHIIENLIVVTPAIHARITAFEWRLFCGDIIGYKNELRKVGMDEAIFDRAWNALKQQKAA